MFTFIVAQALKSRILVLAAAGLLETLNGTITWNSVN